VENIKMETGMTLNIKNLSAFAFGCFFSLQSQADIIPDDLIDVTAIGNYPAEIASLNSAKFHAGVNILSSRDSYRGGSLYQPDPLPFPITVTGTNADSKTSNTLPTFLFATPLPIPSHKLVLGFGLVTPTDFVGDIQFPIDSVVRYNYTRSFYINNIYTAVLAYRFNEMFSFGAGIDRNRITLKYSAALPSNLSGTPQFDNFTNNIAEGWSTSWHASALAKIKKTHTILEAAYRSKADVDATGTSTFYFQKTPLVLIGNNKFHVPISVPDQFRFKIVQPITKNIITSASYIYSRWSVIKILPFDNIALPIPSGSVNENFNFFWKDTSTVAFGARVYFNEDLFVTPTVAWSESVYPFSEDYYVGGFDLGYKLSKQVQLIFNYYHQFSYNYDPLPIGSSLFDGSTKSSIDLVGLKFNYLFDNNEKTMDK
jgi:long-subunit fatty acid transport protein